MGCTGQEPRQGSALREAPPQGPPQETNSGSQTTLDSGRSGIRRKKEVQFVLKQEVAVILVDEYGKLELQE